ncbi:MAG: DUF222 domain-containing protein, partial [Mycobacterium sp.]
MPDLIRLAEHAHHYLVVYREHTAEPLYLGRSKRLATKAQRLLLYQSDRGCTRPGCTHAAYLRTLLDVWARPGINNPDDPQPRHNTVPNPLEEDPAPPADCGGGGGGGAEPGPVEEVPFLRDTEQQRRDLRTDTQRTHDAIKAVLRDT